MSNYVDSDLEIQNLRSQLAREHAENTRLRTVIEADRTLFFCAVKHCKQAMVGFEWLGEGRGSYEWDDDKYQTEFSTAYNHIIGALNDVANAAGNMADRLPTDEQEKAARQIAYDELSLSCGANDAKMLKRINDALTDIKYGLLNIADLTKLLEFIGRLVEHQGLPRGYPLVAELAKNGIPGLNAPGMYETKEDFASFLQGLDTALRNRAAAALLTEGTEVEDSRRYRWLVNHTVAIPGKKGGWMFPFLGAPTDGYLNDSINAAVDLRLTGKIPPGTEFNELVNRVAYAAANALVDGRDYGD